MSPALLAYRALTGVVEPLAPLWLRRRVRAGREHPDRWREKLARAPVERPDGPLVWLHGASVGETLSLLPLIAALRDLQPTAAMLVTTGTLTADSLLDRRLPEGVRRRFAPLDAPGAARRFVAQWRPDVAVFAESEIWPNLLREVRRRGGRTALVSARLSERSLAGWARAPGAARAVFAPFDLVLAQDDATAAALVRLGARDDGRMNLKIMGGPLPVDPLQFTLMDKAAIGARPLVAASTHPGEDEAILDAYAQARRHHALLVIAPRHPERGPEIAALARAKGFKANLRSQNGWPEAGVVHVADTLGELGLYFRLVRTNGGSVFVGGSMVSGPGGHNPLEPVRAGAPVVSGPHVENWRDVYALLGDGVVRVDGAAELARAWRADLDVPEAAQARANRAAERLAAGEPLSLAIALRAIGRMLDGRE